MGQPQSPRGPWPPATAPPSSGEPGERLTGRARDALAIALISIPIIILIVRLLAWVRIGIDLPVSDDWLAYFSRRAGSLDPAWLFTASHDTLSPVGKALESIAHLTMGGNTVVYQLVTMALVLGGFLIMQWKLLRWAFSDVLHTAIVFVICSLMLLSRAYWGGVNGAYLQVLPLVVIMAAIVVAMRPAGPSRWAILVGLGLGLTGGLSYISGAFGAAAAGATMVFIGFVARFGSRFRIRQVGVGLLIGGLITVAAQLMATRVAQGESHVGNTLAMPTDPEFWYFMLGKIGASLGLDPWGRPKLTLALTLGAVAMGVVAVAWSLLALRRRPAAPPRPDVVATVTLTLAATIFVYLMMISAARAYSWPLPEGYGPIDRFQTGFHRFHFYWVTAFWPWVGAVALSLILGWARRRSARIRSALLALAVAAPLAFVFWTVRAGAFDYDWFFGQWAKPREAAYECFLKNMQGDDGQGCYGIPPDVVGLIAYAKSVDASWARGLETVPVPPSTLLFSMNDESSGWIDVLNAEATRTATSLSIPATDDVQMMIWVADTESMGQCRSLEVRAELRPERDDSAQVFYQRPDDEGFSQQQMVSSGVVYGDGVWPKTVHLIYSEDGFFDTLRYDPVFTAQDVEVQDVEVYCRLFKK